MKKIAGTALVVIAILLAGCNTVQGVGRDVSSVGRTVEKAAQ